MLVLTRRRQEVVYLDFSKMTDSQLLALRGEEPIKLTVVETCNDKVRIGFDAPRSVRIDRSEVSQRKKQPAVQAVN
jgi:sRNA-binding carbon storage regulator CsrA